MSAIINSIIARKAGIPSIHVEALPSNGTTGHASDQPGLRGHSIGHHYPYGVVGYGKRWMVCKHGRPVTLQARHHPAGWVPACYPTIELASRIVAKLGSGNVASKVGANIGSHSWAEVEAFFTAYPAFATGHSR